MDGFGQNGRITRLIQYFHDDCVISASARFARKTALVAALFEYLLSVPANRIGYGAFHFFAEYMLSTIGAIKRYGMVLR